MNGGILKEYRSIKRLTQQQAARRLSVSQTYYSMLESGLRPLTSVVEKRAVAAFGLSPVYLPARFDRKPVSDEQLATALASLGYPGFSHLKKGKGKNPADVLFAALNADKRDARLVEALPWLLMSFPEMDWETLVENVKHSDLQNRLGFLTSMARDLALRHGDKMLGDEFADRESRLFRSLLFKQDTLCNETMTQVERKWLAKHRSRNAKKWRILTDMDAQRLNYYAK